MMMLFLLIKRSDFLCGYNHYTNFLILNAMHMLFIHSYDTSFLLVSVSTYFILSTRLLSSFKLTSSKVEYSTRYSLITVLRDKLFYYYYTDASKSFGLKPNKKDRQFPTDKLRENVCIERATILGRFI